MTNKDSLLTDLILGNKPFATISILTAVAMIYMAVAIIMILIIDLKTM